MSPQCPKGSRLLQSPGESDFHTRFQYSVFVIDVNVQCCRFIPRFFLLCKKFAYILLLQGIYFRESYTWQRSPERYTFERTVQPLIKSPRLFFTSPPDQTFLIFFFPLEEGVCWLFFWSLGLSAALRSFYRQMKEGCFESKFVPSPTNNNDISSVIFDA